MVLLQSMKLKILALLQRLFQLMPSYNYLFFYEYLKKNCIKELGDLDGVLMLKLAFLIIVNTRFNQMKSYYVINNFIIYFTILFYFILLINFSCFV